MFSKFTKAFLAGLLYAGLTFAQVPQGVNFQGIARDASGLALQQGTVIGLRLSVLQGSATGNTVYSEEFPSVTLDRGGLFNVVFGKGSPIVGSFTGINWQGANKWLRIEMRQGSGTYLTLNTTEMMSVPYAQHAGNGIGSATVNAQGQLVLTYSNGTTVTAGNVVGPQGPSGVAGAQGQTGPAGPQGPVGPSGPQGPAGATGAQGPAGPAGATGPQGPVGATGAQGPAGNNGNAVLNGTGMPTASVGVVGDFYLDLSSRIMYGPKTSSGWGAGFSITGPQGPQGATGPAGPAGPQGATGPQGLQGATGPAGPAGPQGATGPQGPQGPQGPAGPQGATGAQGLPGVAGFNPWAEYMILEERRPNNIGAGNSNYATNPWLNRQLNTGFPSSSSSFGNIVLSPTTGIITLTPGTYYIDGDAPAFKSNRHKLGFFNVLTGNMVITGTSEYSWVSTEATTRSFLRGVITVTSTSNFQLRHRIETSFGGSQGLGVETNDGISQEVYARLLIQKIQ